LAVKAGESVNHLLSHRSRCQILTEDKYQIIWSIVCVVIFTRNLLDALAMADESVYQAGIFAVTVTPVSQCFVTDLAKDVVRSLAHPEVNALEPLEFELLLTPNQWHANSYMDAMTSSLTVVIGRGSNAAGDFYAPRAAMMWCTAPKRTLCPSVDGRLQRPVPSVRSDLSS
jgi:hypothetical protein